MRHVLVCRLVRGVCSGRPVERGAGTQRGHSCGGPPGVDRSEHLRLPGCARSRPRGGAGVGVLLRWTGHTDTPVTCAQPKCGYLPLGDIAWYRPGALEFYEGSSTSRSLSIGTTYLFRAQVDSDGSGNTYYKLRVWEQGTAEPATWDLEDTVGPSDKQNGCLLLISHMADVTFGNVTITPGSLSLNNPPTWAA